MGYTTLVLSPSIIIVVHVKWRRSAWKSGPATNLKCTREFLKHLINIHDYNKSSRSHLAAEVPAVTTEFSTSPWARSHIYTGLHNLCSSESAIYDVAFKL